jgi:hypothetical protein
MKLEERIRLIEERWKELERTSARAHRRARQSRDSVPISRTTRCRPGVLPETF